MNEKCPWCWQANIICFVVLLALSIVSCHPVLIRCMLVICGWWDSVGKLSGRCFIHNSWWLIGWWMRKHGNTCNLVFWLFLCTKFCKFLGCFVLSVEWFFANSFSFIGSLACLLGIVSDCLELWEEILPRSLWQKFWLFLVNNHCIMWILSHPFLYKTKH